MPRKINMKQRSMIQYYVRRGYSANKVQKQLSKQHLGLRRKVLLRQIREFKRKPSKPHVEKYYPRARMQRRIKRGIPSGEFIQKQIARALRRELVRQFSTAFSALQTSFPDSSCFVHYQTSEGARYIRTWPQRDSLHAHCH